MTAFLVDPTRVDRLLAALPALRAALKPAAEEGHPSSGYPRLRKTPLQVYRLLANPHYAHLRDALRAIEATHAAGCSFGELLKTDDYELFQSHMSEVRAAEYFRCRSLTVKTIPLAGSRTADLRVAGDGLDATVEVYTRREWLALDQWDDSLRDGLKNVDRQVDFGVSVSTRDTLPRGPWWPWDLALALAKTRVQVLEQILADFDAAINVARTAYVKTYEHEGAGLETEVELHEMREGSEAPARWLSMSGPGFGGYSPAGVLRRIIEGPLRDKAGRSQAQAAASGVRCLVIDLSRSKIDLDLRDPAHRAEARELVAKVDPGEFGLDLIAFYRPYSGRLRGRCDHFTVFDDTRMSRGDAEYLFGSATVS